MKTTLRAKLLQHIAGKKKANEGFTLIELLVVIIIIGILAAIALPSFLNQANKAKQTEALTNVGAINRGQQAYRLENEKFSDNISGIGVGIKAVSERYTFGSSTTYDPTKANKTLGLTGTALAEAGSLDAVGGVYAAPEDPLALKGYTGIAYLLKDNVANETTSTIVLCESIQAGAPPTLTVNNSGGLVTTVACAGKFK
ncbi:type IV pilin-like G/H family protein [Leptothoe sp. PORK10 BA2]|uniref:type IV pilin-like G/H family protein n=1 Tax=Leptothoe sp. PORK10 BA2 TaxID=3110254 RepID=UPI002B218260|nr:type IV pilin-like G/H family protein [Leptothoe sp. PORK10 BA2]MEA5466095.1 type IV pilin-like G/H family protein [Leptothoe sp. PORK10 BA2]